MIPNLRFHLRSLFPSARRAVRFQFPSRSALAIAALLFVMPAKVFGNACTSNVASGNWSATGSWTGCGGLTPTSADSVTIKSGQTITMDTSPTISSMTIVAGGTLIEDNNGRTLTLNTAAAVPFTNGGTFAPNKSTVVINGNAALTLTGGTSRLTFNNLTLNPTITLARIYTIGGGSVTVNGKFLIAPSAASALALTVNMGSNMTTGLTSIAPTASATATMSTTVSGYKLTTSSMSVATGGTFAPNGSEIVITGTSGTLLTGGGTFAQGTSTYTFIGDGTTTLTSNNVFTFNNLTLTPTLTTSRVYTFGTSSVTVVGQLNVNPSGSANSLTASLGAATGVTGAITVQRGGASATSVLDTTTSNWNVSTSSLTIKAGGTVQGNGSTIILNTATAVPITNNGTFTPGTSTVIIKGDAALTLTAGSITFNNLMLNPTITLARIYTMSATPITINGAFTINPIAASALALTVNMASNLTTGGLSVTRTTSATAVFSTTVSSYRLTASTISVAAGGTLIPNGSEIDVNGTSGTLLTGGGTFAQGTSSYTFTGDGTATLTSNNAFTFNNLVLSPTLTADRTYTFGTSSVTVVGMLNIGPSGSANTLSTNLGATTGVTGGITVQSGGSATGKLDTTASNWTVTTSSLTIGTGGIVVGNGSTITLNTTTAVPLTNNGTFTPNTSTVLINGDAALTLTSGAVTLNNLTLSPTLTLARTYTMGAAPATITGTFRIAPSAASALALTVNMASNLAVSSMTTVAPTGSATATFQTTPSNYQLTTSSLTVAAAGSFIPNGSEIVITGTSGTLLTGGGTFAQGTSTVTFTGDGTATLTSNKLFTFNDLKLTPTITAGRAYTFGTSSLTVVGDFTINPTAASTNALTVNLGATTGVTGTTTVTGTTNGTSTLTTTASNRAFTTGNLFVDTPGTFLANASVVALNGTFGTLFTNNGTFTAGTSIVTMTPDASVAATAGTITFSTLTVTPTVTAGRVYTFGTGPISANNFTIAPTAGTSQNLTVSLGDTLTVTSTMTISQMGSATATLDTTAASYAVNASNLSIKVNSTFLANGSTITLSGSVGTIFLATGTFTPGTSRVVFTGDGTLTLTSNNPITFYNLDLTPTITLARAYTFGNNTLTINDDFTINPTAASALALTVNLGAPTTAGGTTTVTGTTSGTATLTTTASNRAFTTGNLFVDTPGTFLANASVVTLNGIFGTLFTNNGTFTAGTSIVAMTPDASVTATAGTITFSTLTVTPAITSARTYTFGSGVLAANNMTIAPSAGTAQNLTVSLGNTTNITATLTVSQTGSATSTLDTTAGSYAVNAAALAIKTSGTFKANGSTVTLSGTTGPLLIGAGTLLPDGSRVSFTGNAGLTLTSNDPFTFYNLDLTPTITLARAYTFGTGALTVKDDFTINPTAASALNLAVTMTSSITVSGLTSIMGTTSGTSSLTTGTNFDLETGQLNLAASCTLTANASTLRLDGASGTLFTRAGTFAQGTSMVNVASPGSATLNSGTITFNNLTITATGQTVTMGAAITTTGLTISSGTLDDAGNQITGNAGGVFTMGPNGILSLGSAGTATTFPTLYTAANCVLNAGSTVTYNAGVAQTVSGTPTYGNLQIASGSGTPTKTLGAAINVLGDLTIGASNTLATSGSNFAMTLWGGYNNNGTYTANTASATLRSPAAESLNGTLNGTSSFGTLLLNGAGIFTPTSALTVSGDLVVTVGTMTSASNVTVNGNVTGNGTTGLLNFTGGTFEQRVAAAQTFGTNAAGANNWTFNNLTFSNSAASNLVVTVNGTGTGQVIVNGVLAVGKAGDTNLTTLDDSVNNRTLDANSDVNITATGVLSASGSTPLTVGGNWAGSGTLTANSGAVVFTGAVIHQLSGSTTFYTLRALTSGATMQFTAGTTNYVTSQVDFQNVALFSSSNGTTWYFVMSGASETLSGLTVRDSNASGGNYMNASNSVDVSNNTFWDFGVPGQITTLVAVSSTTGHIVSLGWTSSGNDGATGTLINSVFTIHYTTDTAFATGSGWNPTANLPVGVSSITISTTNVNPGTSCGTDLTSLLSGGTYYVRIWTSDQGGRYSNLSNGATATVVVTVLGLQLSQTTINFASLSPGTTNVITSSITATNTGNVPERFELSINNSANWTATSAGAGLDQFRLSALFKSTLPVSADFNAANDVLTTSTTTASSTQFARDADAVTEKAISVPPGATRGLWFQMEMPPMSTTVAPQTIHLTGNSIE